MSEVPWVPNALAVKCFNCKAEFRLTKRKHHCRACGNVFCGTCTSKRISLPTHQQPERVCDSCEMKYSKYSNKPEVKKERTPQIKLAEFVKHFYPTYHSSTTSQETVKLILKNVILFWGSDSEMMDLLTDDVMLSLKNQIPLSPSIPFYPGTLVVTNFQVYFFPEKRGYLQRSSSPLPGSSRLVDEYRANKKLSKRCARCGKSLRSLIDVIAVPLMTLAKVDALSYEQKDMGVLELVCKDVRTLRFCFLGLVTSQSYGGFNKAKRCLDFYANLLVTKNIRYLFAFKYKHQEAQVHKTQSDDSSDSDRSSSPSSPPPSPPPSPPFKSPSQSSKSARERSFSTPSPTPPLIFKSVSSTASELNRKTRGLLSTILPSTLVPPTRDTRDKDRIRSPSAITTADRRIREENVYPPATKTQSTRRKSIDKGKREGDVPTKASKKGEQANSSITPTELNEDRLPVPVFEFGKETSKNNTRKLPVSDSREGKSSDGSGGKTESKGGKPDSIKGDRPKSQLSQTLESEDVSGRTLQNTSSVTHRSFSAVNLSKEIHALKSGERSRSGSWVIMSPNDNSKTLLSGEGSSVAPSEDDDISKESTSQEDVFERDEDCVYEKDEEEYDTSKVHRDSIGDDKEEESYDGYFNPSISASSGNWTSEPTPTLFSLEEALGFVGEPSSSHDGWFVYEPRAEYARMGIPDSGRTWRLSKINQYYDFCPTYPSLFAVPHGVNDSELKIISSFRSRQRIPVVTWKAAFSNTVLMRSAQPMTGLMGQRCAQDESFFHRVVSVNERSKSMLIVDCRPLANAVAQAAMGAGYEGKANYETTSHLKECHIEFLGIDNIHVMRKSMKGVMDLCIRTNESLAQGFRMEGIGNVGGVEASGPNSPWMWWNGLATTGHLHHLSQIIAAGNFVARHLHRGISVLCHCSDGWDRTAQVCSLAEISLDPFYRTLIGFQVLIEKEWNSFGHKFSERTAHGNTTVVTEVSPVFLQFIDCVWQMTMQFPAYFEFNEALLIFIIDHLYSCQYGTFLCNSEREKIQLGLTKDTISLWTAVNNRRDDFINPLYIYSAEGMLSDDEEEPKLALDTKEKPEGENIYLTGPKGKIARLSAKWKDRKAISRSRILKREEILIPDVRKLKFWTNYYLRWESPLTHKNCQESSEHVVTSNPAAPLRLHQKLQSYNSKLQTTSDNAAYYLCSSILERIVWKSVSIAEAKEKSIVTQRLLEVKSEAERASIAASAEIKEFRGALAHLEAKLAIEKILSRVCSHIQSSSKASRKFSSEEIGSSRQNPSSSSSSSSSSASPSLFSLLVSSLSSDNGVKVRPSLEDQNTGAHQSLLEVEDPGELLEQEPTAESYVAIESFKKEPEDPTKSNRRSEPPKQWIPDNLVTACRRCARPFSTFYRKHHCRICGDIFCGNCTFKSKTPLHGALSRGNRVCLGCGPKSTDGWLNKVTSAPAIQKTLA